MSVEERAKEGKKKKSSQNVFLSVRPSASSMGVSVKKRKKEWRCGVSIPVPLACEANALPSELHPLYPSGGDHLHKHTDPRGTPT